MDASPDRVANKSYYLPHFLLNSKLTAYPDELRRMLTSDNGTGGTGLPAIGFRQPDFVRQSGAVAEQAMAGG